MNETQLTITVSVGVVFGLMFLVAIVVLYRKHEKKKRG